MDLDISFMIMDLLLVCIVAIDNDWRIYILLCSVLVIHLYYLFIILVMAIGLVLI